MAHVGIRCVCAFVAIVFCAGCASTPAPARPTIQARVPVVPSSNGSVTPVSTLGGLIVPFQNVQLQSTLTEPVLAVNVQEGDHVHTGQVLAQLDTSDLRAQLQSALGTAAANGAKATQAYDQAGLTISQNANSINAAKAALKQAQQTLATDTLNEKRDLQLLANGYIAQQTVDQQRTLVANDGQTVRSQTVALQNQLTQVSANGTTSSGLQGATVAAARGDEQTAIGSANQIRAQIAKASIVSPVNGVVVNRNLNPGEYPGTRQIFTLQETDKVYAVLSGSSAQISGVRNGETVKIVSSDRPTLQSTGRIVAVLGQVTPGSTNFGVKVLLANPTAQFQSGMVVSGNVSPPSTRGIVVPATAFLDDTHTAVQIVSNGQVHTVAVTLVAMDAKRAVVRGIAKGAAVVVNGQLGLADGQTVRAVKGTKGSSASKTVAEK